MYEELKVRSWVAIRRGCSITYRVHAEDDIDFRCGSSSEEFEFTFDAEALRELVRVGTAALGEADAMREAAMREAVG